MSAVDRQPGALMNDLQRHNRMNFPNSVVRHVFATVALILQTMKFDRRRRVEIERVGCLQGSFSDQQRQLLSPRAAQQPSPVANALNQVRMVFDFVAIHIAPAQGAVADADVLHCRRPRPTRMLSLVVEDQFLFSRLPF
jgi:hypothetical protein